MKLVWWFAGVMATIYGIKFVIAVFQRLTGKQQINSLIDKANKGIQTTAQKTAEYIKQKREEKDNRPRVTIR